VRNGHGPLFRRRDGDSLGDADTGQLQGAERRALDDSAVLPGAGLRLRIEIGLWRPDDYQAPQRKRAAGVRGHC
jgi:hypothetical protein